MSTSSRRRGRFSLFLAVFAGAVGGVGAVVVSTRLFVTAPAGPTARAVEETRAAAAVPPAADGEELTQLRARLSALERRTEAESARADAAPPRRDEGRPSAEELRDSYAAEDRKLESRYQAERADPAWSAKAASSLRAQMTDVADAGFAVEDVECHMTLCKAKVRWPSLEDAQRGYTKILHAQYDVNCGRSVYLAPPDSPGASYEATTYFDCATFREGN